MSGERPGSACAEVRRLLLEGSQSADDGATEARAAAHLGRCPDCQQARDRLQGLRADVERAATPLDDMRRARVLARLASALDNQAADGGARRRGRGLRPGLRGVLPSVSRWVLAAAFGGFAVAALALWLATTRQPPAPAAAVASRPAVTQPAANPPSVAPAARASEQLAVLQPYRPANAGGTAGPPGAGRSPAGARGQAAAAASRHTRHRDADRARPAARDPERGRPAGGEPRPRHAGGGYDHRAGGQLLVRSPGALTRVVGTLFSVKAADDSSRIVVARGRVLVTGEGGPVHTLAAGDALSTDSGTSSSAGRAMTGSLCRITRVTNVTGRRPSPRRSNTRARSRPASFDGSGTAVGGPARPHSRTAAGRIGRHARALASAGAVRDGPGARAVCAPGRSGSADGRPRTAAGDRAAFARPRPNLCTSGPSRPCASATGPRPAGNWRS